MRQLLSTNIAFQYFVIRSIGLLVGEISQSKVYVKIFTSGKANEQEVKY